MIKICSTLLLLVVSLSSNGQTPEEFESLCRLVKVRFFTEYSKLHQNDSTENELKQEYWVLSNNGNHDSIECSGFTIIENPKEKYIETAIVNNINRKKIYIFSSDPPGFLVNFFVHLRTLEVSESHSRRRFKKKHISYTVGLGIAQCDLNGVNVPYASYIFDDKTKEWMLLRKR